MKLTAATAANGLLLLYYRHFSYIQQLVRCTATSDGHEGEIHVAPDMIPAIPNYFV